MNSRERIKRIIAGEEADRCGFWLGNPHSETWKILHDYFGTSDDEEVRLLLNDDFRWIMAGTYRHPEGKPVFESRNEMSNPVPAGVFADCENLREVENFPWPNPDYLDFTETLERLKKTGEFYRASGFWAPFFHDVADFFDMENYFIKMYTHPEIVHAVTRHVVDYYLEANRRLFKVAGDLIDGYFFGNDFGTQLDLLISPRLFEEFIFPYFQELIATARAEGYQVLLHSCGAVHRIIPDFMKLGIDALHPLQAKARNMDAVTLSGDFGGKLAFIGGIDTQDLLMNATPAEVTKEVDRVKSLLGPRLIISPSHECLLPNIPPANVKAMAEANRKYNA